MALERTDILDPAKAPAGKRTVKVSSPNIADLTVIESVPISSEKYKPIPYGSPHPDYSNNGLILVWQDKVKAENNQVFAVRVYASRNVNQDWFNFALHYAGDVAACPIFVRSYTVLRAGFTPATRGQPFNGVYQLLVTNQGSGYTSKPAVVFTGANTTPAVANAIMNETGDKVIGLELTTEGDGYSAAPTISFTGGGGSGAAATAFVQPASALLVKEETLKLDQEEPQMASLFIKVNRIYETLPGPILIWDEYTDERGPVQKTTQSILAVGNEVGLIAVVGSTFTRTGFEPRDGSKIVLTKMVETFTLPGPILTRDHYEDEKASGQRNRGAVQRTEQLITQVGNEVATFARIGGGKAQKTSYEERKDMPGFVLNKIIETWTEIVIHDKAMTEEFGGGILTIDETRDEPGIQTPDEGYLVVESDVHTVSPDEQIKTAKTLVGTAWPETLGDETDPKYGIVVDISKKVVPGGTLYPGVAVSLVSPYVDIQPHSKYRSIQIVSKVRLPLPEPEFYPIVRPLHIPPTLLSVEAVWDDIESKLVEALATSATASVSSGSGGGVIVRRTAGFHGNVVGIGERLWFFGPPALSDIPALIKIIGSAGTVVLFSTHSKTHYAGGDDGAVSFGDSYQNQIHATDVNDLLVGDYDVINANHFSPPQSALAISGGGSIAAVSAAGTLAYMNVQIPASTPAKLADIITTFHGMTRAILIDVIIERWRLGVWTMELEYVQVPVGIA